MIPTQWIVECEDASIAKALLPRLNLAGIQLEDGPLMVVEIPAGLNPNVEVAEVRKNPGVISVIPSQDEWFILPSVEQMREQAS